MVICIPYIYGRTAPDLPPLPLPGSQGHRVTGLRVTGSPDPQGHQTMVSRVTESTDPPISPSPGSPLGVWSTRVTHHQTHPTMGHQTHQPPGSPISRVTDPPLPDPLDHGSPDPGSLVFRVTGSPISPATISIMVFWLTNGSPTHQTTDARVF